LGSDEGALSEVRGVYTTYGGLYIILSPSVFKGPASKSYPDS